tara:strand:- start:256 stop:654 length:399 start_codon:yes stop_codon:yes gene_type:complete
MKAFFYYGGSLIPIIIMVYCYYVMKAVKIFKITDEFDLPLIFKHPSSELIILAGLFGLVFSSIYIWLFSGLVASVISFFALMFIGKWGGLIMGFHSKKFIGFHYIIACVLLPIGYYIFFAAIWNTSMLILNN